MKKCNGWIIYGITPIDEDSEYQIIQKAIKAGKVEQAYLQDVTGWCNPIIIDKKNMIIDFRKF